MLNSIPGIEENLGQQAQEMDVDQGARIFLQELQDDRCGALHRRCSCGYLQGTLLSEAALAAGRLLDH